MIRIILLSLILTGCGHSTVERDILMCLGFCASAEVDSEIEANDPAVPGSPRSNSPEKGGTATH